MCVYVCLCIWWLHAGAMNNSEAYVGLRVCINDVYVAYGVCMRACPSVSGASVARDKRLLHRWASLRRTRRWHLTCGIKEVTCFTERHRILRKSSPFARYSKGAS